MSEIRSKKMKTFQFMMKTKIRNLYLVASELGLQSVSNKKQKSEMVQKLNPKDPIQKILLEASRQLVEYLDGKRKIFQLPLDLVGTSFQKQVWQALLKIPFGTTNSYKDIAQRIKNPKAVRAVGSANGKNPLCIIVPCHRVIAHDGSLGGYSGGLDFKKQLLELEASGRELKNTISRS